jgi:phosphate transport system permease protein
MTQSYPEENSSFDSSGLVRANFSSRTLFNNIMTGVAFILTAMAVIPLFAVLIYVTFQGITSITPSVFVELPPPPMVEGGGFGNAIVGTIIMVGIGALISVPFGVMASIYLTEFSKGKVARGVRFSTNILSGVPSIIAGVFAYAAVVLTFNSLGWGSYSPIAGGIALAVLMLPIIVRTTDEALQLVPQDVRQAAVGLGATKFQTVWGVVLPAAVPAIVTGTTLGVARAAGETAPLLFTALFSQFWPQLWPPDAFLQPTASLAVLVYNFAIVPFQNQQKLAWAASLILILLVLLTSIITRYVTRKKA